MHVWRHLADVDAVGPTVVTIGNFDGVHRGHQALLRRGRESADAAGLPLVVVTFDPHPMAVIRPDAAPEPLADLDTRLGLLQQSGADAVLVLRFTAELAATTADDFAESVVFGTLSAAEVVVGENFRFGHRAQGDVALLRRLGEQYGAKVDAVPLQGPADGTVWSSSSIRQLIGEGDVEAAAEALGRLHAVRGTVVRGHQRGRELLGVPTANVPVGAASVAVPADGVYAGWLCRLDPPGEPAQPAAISVGTNPTFDDVERTVEAYVIDRDDLELYGVAVEVSFAARLRGMERFDSVDGLRAQMQADIAATRHLLC